jgi:hypothetical protein
MRINKPRQRLQTLSAVKNLKSPFGGSFAFVPGDINAVGLHWRRTRVRYNFVGLLSKQLFIK